jgi:CheY-like chemotaxis protein
MGGANLLAGRSVLIVENEPLIAMDMAKIIADCGARSLLARTCKQAVELTETEHLSAAILDYGCGDVDQTTALCGHLAKRHIPYMFYTGYDDLDESCRGVLLVRKCKRRGSSSRAQSAATAVEGSSTTGSQSHVPSLPVTNFQVDGG